SMLCRRCMQLCRGRAHARKTPLLIICSILKCGSLKHCVNKRSKRRTLGYDNEGSQQEQGHNDRQDPPAPTPKEGKQLAGGLEVSSSSLNKLHERSPKKNSSEIVVRIVVLI
ncbi:MAG: hypothetical protein WAM78_08275, partial [Candidatus Sulfotelmatobacter sp.]